MVEILRPRSSFLPNGSGRAVFTVRVENFAGWRFWRDSIDDVPARGVPETAAVPIDHLSYGCGQAVPTHDVSEMVVGRLDQVGVGKYCPRFGVAVTSAGDQRLQVPQAFRAGRFEILLGQTSDAVEQFHVVSVLGPAVGAVDGFLGASAVLTVPAPAPRGTVFAVPTRKFEFLSTPQALSRLQFVCSPHSVSGEHKKPVRQD
ncbi:hypothetical protein [Phaeobacter sp. 22II1-1F12B]|uniref:hypothetical protein n=1 Tax=Phaeobacter sp. 22II1-1F12B TaxID=1317111 RepID=UPI0011848774|nr:hypothetical protein [Phaeobacter sp. 22II1-1F12B]